MKCLAMAGSPFVSASEHATSIREREMSCRELAELYIGRIHKHNPALHAIVISNEADVIRTAYERDDDLAHNIVRGPLHGVPVTVKEAFNLAGLKTTVNFPQLKNNIAATDALIVKRLKEAGATILGKTNIRQIDVIVTNPELPCNFRRFRLEGCLTSGVMSV